MTETETKALLTERGVPVAEGGEGATVDEAVDIATRIGWPVVVKISHPGATHKSDLGGVVLDVRGDEPLRAAAGRLLSLLPGARVRVEQQAAPGGVDLILGFRRDPVFGPVLMAGIGGIYAELLADTALRIGPLDEAQAMEMLGRLKGRGLLEGARGRPALDRVAAARTLVALAALAHDRPDIRELEINPFRVSRDGGLALDARAFTGEAPNIPIQTHPGAGAIPDRGRIDPFFNPRRVAVVGPSTAGRKAGNIILDNLRTLGFRGEVYPVNPAGGEIDGLKSYRSVADCPGPPELAVLAVPYHQVDRVLRDVAAAGVHHAIVASGGFADAGPAGREREGHLVAFCHEQGIHLMGPNSIGTLDSRSGFCSSIGTLPPVPPSGIAILGQSGTFTTGFVLQEITGRGRGFGKVACLGNKADVDESDFLDYYAGDDDTRVIGIYLESVKDGPRFMAAAARAVAAKPVVVLKSGRSELGARAAASHTGALAGEEAVFEAFFRQEGLQRVNDLTEFFEVLRAFDSCPLPAGNRIAVVSITGVGCVLAADAIEACAMALAPISPETQARLQALVPHWATVTNPADIWSTIEQRGPAAAYREMAGAMIADDEVDILLVIAVLLDEGAFDARATFAPVREAFPDKPILACCLGGRQSHLDAFTVGIESIGIPVTSGPAAAVRAASFLYRRRQIVARARAQGLTRCEGGG